MAVQVLKQPKIWLGDHALAPDVFRTTYSVQSEAVDDTAFGDATRSSTAGLTTASFSEAGYFQAGSATELVDSVINARVGNQNTIRMIDPAGDSTLGNPIYMSRFTIVRYNPFDSVEIGSMHGFSCEGVSDGTPQLRGSLLDDATRDASANTSQFAVGAVSAGQTVYAALVCTSAGGTSPTLDVKIQHDTTGMSSPTDYITFTQLTGRGSEWKTATTATTDTFWRAVVTIGGSSPEFTFAVAMAIA
jgi:hypothetical protein